MKLLDSYEMDMDKMEDIIDKDIEDCKLKCDQLSKKIVTLTSSGSSTQSDQINLEYAKKNLAKAQDQLKKLKAKKQDLIDEVSRFSRSQQKSISSGKNEKYRNTLWYIKKNK